ncbi:probable WRKY transcription factor protein 1 isoform X2 [Acyrthosiphon pisum]|uniref:ALMS motif domain-containing protein n=1 Tax=Acyrthosiphon pisum TaxID=7029 RepID=A0A8R2FAJ2_ACYPI|nr:probable WRKY transcription factor protein 1 isoform X2 [Acyrthosiphon pisum]|eukprot:XP_008185356.1 PREDICTED: probable WRKY transcription factor protein 1 isoform X2 [Acyrthosiphon pisum]
MSDPSDFESIISDIVISPCSIDSLDNENATVNDDNSLTTISRTSNIIVNTMNDDGMTTYDPPQHEVSLTDSDHSLLEVPKQLNASSPSSVCSTRPLEWDSGADVGYDITSKHQSQDMSTIERIAVSSLVYNTNSTPISCENQRIRTKTKSNSLDNLNDIELSKGKKSTSLDVLKFTAEKSDTLPKCRSPMASSLSVSTVVHKLESLKTECINKLIEKNVSLIFNQQEKRFKNLSGNSNTEQKSSGSSKESNSTLGSADTAGSWVAKEFHDSTNNTSDRVNSFEYLPGNSYYNTRNDEQEDYSDKEIKQSTKMLVEAMKQNGLTNEFQRKEIFKEIIESFVKKYTQKDKDNSSLLKSPSDTDQTPIRQDFTSQTSNTANTIVNNPTNNHSSTITFTSPITSSRYGDDVDSKYYESSMDSGRHINLQKCKIKKPCTLTNKQKDQSVQCTIQDNLTDVSKSGNSKPAASTKKNEHLESIRKNDTHSKTKYSDAHMDFNKQMIWFHTNYMKTERENQMLWINSQISHLNNLKKRKFPISNSSSDVTTSTYTDSTISSKPVSVTSKSNETDVESSATICDHVHYKKGILVDEPNSLKKCCETTLRGIEEKKNQNTNKFKTAWSQTESTNETKLKNNKNDKSKSGVTYTVDRQLKPISSQSSISYDIIFKPTSRCSKEKDFVNDQLKQQKHSISVACQTNKIPFKPKSSLQEYLMTNRPDYICRAEERQTILTNLASLRDERKQLKRDMLMTNNYENNVPPNPLAVKRVMSQREMRKQTENKYRKCPEVKNKKVEIKRKEEYNTNKIMANIFNKRLQKKTLKGKVDLSNSVSVCSL